MSGKRRSRTKKAEKEYERLGRELAEKKEKASSESEDRQEEIKVLWGLAEQQLGIAKNERKLKEKQLKAQKLKQLLKSLEDLTGNDDLVDPVRELIRLAALQDREIEYLTQFRRDWEEIDAHYPEQLENLSMREPIHAGMRSLAEKHAEQKPELGGQATRIQIVQRGWSDRIPIWRCWRGRVAEALAVWSARLALSAYLP